MIQIGCDVSDALKDLDEVLGKDLPFAVALFLTRQAQSAQEAVRATIPRGKGQIFQTRNDWTSQGIRVKAATKSTLTAEVYTDTSNYKTGAPDYLARQEDGGIRLPIGGREHLAIPGNALIKMVGADRPIPDWLRPKAMLQYAKNNGQYEVVRGKLRAKGVMRSAPVAVRELYFFEVNFRSGARGIMARHVGAARDEVYVMYIFVTRANIRKRFHMQETVEKQLLSGVSQENFDRAMAEVLASKYVNT